MSNKNPFNELTNKSKLYKDWYGLEFAKIISNSLTLKNKESFINDYKRSYHSLELKDRLKLLSSLFEEYLLGSYPQKISKLSKLLGPEYPDEKGMLNEGFYLYPVSQYVEDNALKDIDESLNFIYELTKRFTGEFAIRPIVNHDKKLALRTMNKWSKDKNFHVRRLSSEGLRLRLPWGQGVQWIKEDPSETLPIFNRLKNDPILYVRRSVANSLGDIIKVDEDLGFYTLSSWLEEDPSPNVLWIIKHAIRHPVKKKNKKFLKLKDKINLNF